MSFDYRLDILRAVRDGRSVSLSNILNELVPSDADNYTAAVRQLWHNGYLRSADKYGPFAITDKGKDELLRLEQAAQKMAEQNADDNAKQRAARAQVVADRKKQFRHDFIVAAFGSLFTLFVEYFEEIIQFIFQLF